MAQETLILTEENVIAVIAEVCGTGLIVVLGNGNKLMK